MATETVDAPSGETRASSTASGGTAVSTTVATVGFPIGTRKVDLIPRAFAGANVLRYAFTPWLTVIKTSDAFAADPVDYSNAAQDADAGTDVDLSSLDTLANGDALWIGSHVPFRGVSVDVDAANGNASVLTATYWNGSTLVSLSASDGTTNGFSVDGAITWTVPAAGLWKKVSLASILKATGVTNRDLTGEAFTEPLYWTRFVYSVAFDSATTLNSIHALARSTAYAEIPPTLGVTEKLQHGPGGIGAVELLTDVGTGAVIVNCSSLGGSF